ncbi:Glycosyl hydrolase family 18 [Trichostrongylus colubriformis]|uniref:Glycosyl hydrolase family 18 n=1 Tax=Trichostrongylus colubriformis TaxID=6319 RepID=A0AAN8FE98_TRICO
MITVAIFTLFVGALAKPYHMTCYYNWEQPPLKELDLSLCSHIILIGQVRLDNLGHLQLPPSTISKTIRDKFGSSKLLTVAVSGPPTISKVAYDTSAFNKYVDLVQVMNYDFHIFSFAYPVVGFNAPLRRIRAELGVIGEMNSEASMATWAKLGLWTNKTVFGIPTYGRGFRLVNWRVNKPYSLATGPVDDITRYPQVCQLLSKRNVYSYVWNEMAASPYLHGTLTS